MNNWGTNEPTNMHGIEDKNHTDILEICTNMNINYLAKHGLRYHWTKIKPIRDVQMTSCLVRIIETINRIASVFGWSIRTSSLANIKSGNMYINFFVNVKLWRPAIVAIVLCHTSTFSASWTMFCLMRANYQVAEKSALDSKNCESDSIRRDEIRNVE